MEQITVAHFINPFLPLTQNWIYHQLVWNTECRSIVLCQTLENTHLFPLDHVYAAFPHKTMIASLSMIMARVRAQYMQHYYRTIIIREKPQLFHGHFSWESWRNIRLVNKAHLPLVTTFYGLDVNKLWQKPLWKKRYKLLFQQGDVFTAEGNHMAGALAAIGCPEHKIRVVPLGIDIEKIRSCKQNNHTPSINLLFVGLSREKKGAVDAARAFTRIATGHPRLVLNIIGNGPYAEPIRALLRDAGILRQCIFHGAVSYDEYLKILGNMDIVLSPSVTAADGDTEGGAPVVVSEAQAMGLPVVGTTHCDIPNIVVHDATGLLCAEHDIDMLAHNLARLVEDTQLRTTMGEAGCNRARRHFSIQRQVRELNTIYRSLI